MITLSIIIILILLVLVVTVIPHRISMELDADNERLRINAFVLSFIRVFIFTEGSKLFLQIYIYGNRVYNKRLKKKPQKSNSIIWLKSADIHNIKIEVNYGMKNPFSTGIVSGILGIAATYIRPEELNLYPDFLATEMYIETAATAEINYGNTLINYAKNKRNKTRRMKEWIKI